MQLKRLLRARGLNPREVLTGVERFAGQVDHHGIYDIRVDTSVLTPEEAAEQVLMAPSAGRTPAAFRNLRSRMD